jgi:tRNA(Ser,Leu) C12 N-acetylase TAN1
VQIQRQTRKTWNTVVTARSDRLRNARRALRTLGAVERTGFYNVLTLTIDRPEDFLARLEQLFAGHPDLSESIASVFPAEQCFDFSDASEFARKARDAVLPWAPRLAGRSFHVRLHRRGRKNILVSPNEERAIADALLAATRESGAPARVTFDDPDAIVLVETVGGRAGAACLTREDFRRHPLLATH